MIIDRIENASTYYSLGERFEKALREIEGLYAAPIPAEASKTELDGKNLYYSTQLVECKAPDGKYETHAHYADIQAVLGGEEYMGYANVETLTPMGEYNPEKDVAFHNGEGTMYRFPRGYFAIFFPQDAHMPSKTNGKEPCNSVKIVAKIKLD